VLEAEPLLMAGDAGRRITPDGDDRLGLAFSDDCWVEVRDLEGRRLYSNLSRGGSELTLAGQGPFRVLLGYAPGASLRFNDEPVPLEPHTRNNVASLVLGH
jgi:cytoskeleton protein RodZ